MSNSFWDDDPPTEPKADEIFRLYLFDGPRYVRVIHPRQNPHQPQHNLHDLRKKDLHNPLPDEAFKVQKLSRAPRQVPAPAQG